jgi:hypothetical protein
VATVNALADLTAAASHGLATTELKTMLLTAAAEE